MMIYLADQKLATAIDYREMAPSAASRDMYLDAQGNVIDRATRGHVVDFIDFYVGEWHFAAFNLADAAISVGAALLILDSVLQMRRERRQARQESP